jgi:hypothetical protein
MYPSGGGRWSKMRDFWTLQVAVAALVAIIVMNDATLKAALIGEATGLPDWVKLVSPKVIFK